MEKPRRMEDIVKTGMLRLRETGGGNSPNRYCRIICEKCADTGLVATKNGAVKRCICRIEKIREKKFSLIPRRYKNAALGNYRQTRVEIGRPEKGKCEPGMFPKDFDPKRSYFLGGGLSRGKTHLLWAQYRNLTESGIFSTYAETAIDLIKKYQKQQYEGVCYFDFCREGLHVFVDDLGTVGMTEDRSMQLFDIVDTLYRNNAGLTVTSNFRLRTMEEEETLGPMTTRIVRRIKDMCTVAYF